MTTNGEFLMLVAMLISIATANGANPNSYFAHSRYQNGPVYDFEDDFNGIPEDSSEEVLTHNTKILNFVLRHKASRSSLYFPAKTFNFHTGIYGRDITDFNWFIDGTIRFHYSNKTDTQPCILVEDSKNILITSSIPFKELSGSKGSSREEQVDYGYGASKRGIIDGRGSDYWAIPLIGYLQYGERRPILMEMNNNSNTIIEYLIFRDAALYTMHLRSMLNLEIRYTSIVARRTHSDGHGLYDLSAFNTDGIAVSGKGAFVHDIDIWNQDDCIAVKDGSSNMIFERIHASGLGLAIGSIGGSTVSNITFRDSFLFRSYKGIYMKFRVDESPGIIKDILFSNITIFEPEQWAIWIGPAQQSISGNICKASPCSLCWPYVPFTSCNKIEESQFKNITLRNVDIYKPRGSPGVILGNISLLTLDNVGVRNEVPDSLLKLDRYDLFPGLNEDIRDKYLSPVLAILYALLTFVIFVIIVIIITKGCSKVAIVIEKKRKINSGVDTQSEFDSELVRQKDRKFCHIATMVLAILALLMMIVLSIAFSSTSNRNEYYECQGVVNGTVTGNSTPVSCFGV